MQQWQIYLYQNFFILHTIYTQLILWSFCKTYDTTFCLFDFLISQPDCYDFDFVTMKPKF